MWNTWWVSRYSGSLRTSKKDGGSGVVVEFCVTCLLIFGCASCVLQSFLCSMVSVYCDVSCAYLIYGSVVLVLVVFVCFYVLNNLADRIIVKTRFLHLPRKHVLKLRVHKHSARANADRGTNQSTGLEFSTSRGRCCHTLLRSEAFYTRILNACVEAH